MVWYDLVFDASEVMPDKPRTTSCCYSWYASWK